MSSPQVPDGAVVVGVDGSSASTSALDWAATHARGAGVPLHLVHAGDGLGWGRQTSEHDADPDHPVLERGVARVLEQGDPPRVTAVRCPDGPTTALLAASDDASLIVLGATGAGAVASALLGSVPVQVAARARCPVVTVHTGHEQPSGDAPVVAGLDQPERSARVLAVAFPEAARRGVPLVAVHTWREDPLVQAAGDLGGHQDVEEYPPGHEPLDEMVAPWERRFPEVEVHRHAIRADAADALVSLARGAGLLVVGSHGRRELRGLVLGSVSQEVMRRAVCAVVIVPPGVGARSLQT